MWLRRSRPGTLIIGTKFTDSSTALVASSYPWPNHLGGAAVTIGGEAVPLHVMTSGQTNGTVPFDVAVDTLINALQTNRTGKERERHPNHALAR
jgi:uncharacterized protein (TIGR03437 family)